MVELSQKQHRPPDLNEPLHFGESPLSSPSPIRLSIPVWPAQGQTSSRSLVNGRQWPQVRPRGYAPSPVSPCRYRQNFESGHPLSLYLSSWVKNFPGAEVFVSYALFSSGASHDLRVCHGIGRKCRPVLQAWNLGRTPCDSLAVGGSLLGKSGFARRSRIWR